MEESKSGFGSQSLLRRMLIYFLGNIGTKLVTLVLTRLQSQLILPEFYGQISLITTVVPQLVSICFLEMWSGLLRFMYDQDEILAKKRVFTSALMLAGILLPVFVVGIWILSFYTGQTGLYPYLIVMGLVSLLDYLYQFSSRGLNRNKLYAVTGILTSLVTGLSQILMLSMNLGGMAMIVSPIIGGSFALIIYEQQLGLLRGMKRSHVDFKEIKAMARFCLPLAVNATAYFALTKFNELYISRQAGDVALSNLTVANKTGMFLTIFITIFSLAWQEQAFSVRSDEARAKYYSKVLNDYVGFLGVILFVLIPAGRLIFRILIDGSNYGETSIVLIPFALLAAGTSALSNFMGHIFSAEKRNDELFYTTVLGAVINVLLMVILFPVLGLQAANIALFVGFLATFLTRYGLIRRLLGIDLKTKLFLNRFLLIGFVIILYYLLPTLGAQLIVLAVASLVSIYLLRDMLQNILKSLLARFKRG